MEPGTITVRGTATVPGRPDDLRIALTIAAVAAVPEAALDAGLPVEPGDIEVGASVDVVYRLEQRGS